MNDRETIGYWRQRVRELQRNKPDDDPAIEACGGRQEAIEHYQKLADDFEAELAAKGR